MDDLLKVIKEAAMEAVRQAEPMEVVHGTITQLEPLTIKVDQKMTLTKQFLMVTKEIKAGLTLGKVILIKLQGGQKYLILGMEGD